MVLPFLGTQGFSLLNVHPRIVMARVYVCVCVVLLLLLLMIGKKEGLVPE